MSDLNGGASAPAEVTSTPVEPVVQPPAPINDSPSTPEVAKPEAKAEPAKPISTRDALAKAAERVEKGDKDAAKPAEKATDKAQPVKSDGPTRADDGKFASQKPAEPAEKPVQADAAQKATDTKPTTQTGDDEPPARFSQTAKAKWSTVDPEVRAEAQRAIRELNGGLEKYKSGHEANEELREFHELAKQGGTTVKEALANYTGIEKLLRQDPIAAFEKIASNIGLSFRDVAAFVAGQKPEQVASHQDAKVRGLEGTIARLEQQVQQLSGTFQQQETSALQAQISQFASDKPRFDELRADMAMLLNSGRASDMGEAYALAERMNPGPATQNPPPAPPVAVPDPEAQTLKGTKSVTGAPSAGSTPAAKKPASSPREAIQRAFAQAGA